MLKRLLPGGLAIALLALGCSPLTTPTTAPSPESQVSTGARTPRTPASVKVSTGSLRGQVVDQSGAGVGGVELRTGGLMSMSANPTAGAVLAEVDNGRTMTLMHDFGDGRGEVLAERRVRNTANKADRYVYLRTGEFFIDKVPAGSATVTASFLSASAPPQTVKVTQGKITENVKLVLPLGGAPAPSTAPSGSPSPVAPTTFAEWSGMKPETGLTVRVTATGLTYTPSDPTVQVSLTAKAGGLAVSAYNLVYQWSEGGVAQQSTSERVPVVPTPLMPGQPVAIDVALGGATLAAVYKEKTDPKTGEKTSVLGVVTANLEFLDAAGLAIPGKDGKPLAVAVPIRRL